MRKLIGMVAGLTLVAAVGVTAQVEKTWTGKISDSMCNAKHSPAEHGAKTDADCVRVCVKKGAKYVFVSEGKVFQLENQSSKTIASHAGQEVELTGTMKGDNITALKIRPVTAKPAK